jgi:hypothetical protein
MTSLHRNETISEGDRDDDDSRPRCEEINRDQSLHLHPVMAAAIVSPTVDAAVQSLGAMQK